MNRKQRNMLTRIIIALIMTAGLLIIDVSGWPRLALYLVVYLILGIFGIVNMWLAIFADVGVMILAVLNAIRAMYVWRI